LLYRGGPVLHDPTKYSIYWAPSTPSNNGQVGTAFTPFPSPGYGTTIDSFLSNVALASGTLGNVYSVNTQYEGSGPGEYKSTFGEEFLDAHQYPTRNLTTCPASTKSGDGLPPATQPCISDAEGALQIPEEIVRFMGEYNTAHPTKHLPIGLGAIYYVFAPKEVNSCAGSEGGIAACNTNRYCAYHSAFLLEPGKYIVVYANMPYNAVPGCSTPDEPHKSPADDEINTLSHEDNEAITDPLGNAWYDNAGNEVADKCTYPFFDPASDNNVESDAYGELLGGTPISGSTIGMAYNQLINGGTYLLQREWSNAAGGCVARVPVPVASFAVYSSPGLVNQPISFNASASTTGVGQISSYSWNFGDGNPPASGAQPSHTYTTPGAYTVTLTVTNDSGASASASQIVTVNEPSSSGGQTTTVTTTVTTSAPPTPLPATTRAYTAAQMAGLLRLPKNGVKLSGLGTIFLGHAECPPACAVTLRLYAKVTTVSRKHRVTRLVPVGAARQKGAPKGAVFVRYLPGSSGDLLLSLNAKGRALLRKHHPLACGLVVTVEGQEGGTWQIVRSLTLTR
jgi:PKD repeat protein